MYMKVANIPVGYHVHCNPNPLSLIHILFSTVFPTKRGRGVPQPPLISAEGVVCERVVEKWRVQRSPHFLLGLSCQQVKQAHSSDRFVRAREKILCRLRMLQLVAVQRLTCSLH